MLRVVLLAIVCRPSQFPQLWVCPSHSLVIGECVMMGKAKAAVVEEPGVSLKGCV